MPWRSQKAEIRPRLSFMTSSVIDQGMVRNPRTGALQSEEPQGILRAWELMARGPSTAIDRTLESMLFTDDSRGKPWATSSSSSAAACTTRRSAASSGKASEWGASLDRSRSEGFD